MIRRLLIALIVLLVLLAGVSAYAFLHDRSIEKRTAQGSQIQVLRGLSVSYLAVPATFHDARLEPKTDFGVAANGNVLINTSTGPYELRKEGDTVALEAVKPAVKLDSFAMDRGSVLLGIAGRYFGEIGPDRFEKGLALPPGQLRLASSTRAHSVYLFGREPAGAYSLYVIRGDGSLTSLAQFSEPIRAVGDDPATTYVSTDRALYALADKIRVVSAVTEDFGPADAIAAGPHILFVAANDRIYGISDNVLLAIARGIRPQMILSGNRLYCWDARRELLVAIDVGPIVGGKGSR